jgi:hypothetical protein
MRRNSKSFPGEDAFWNRAEPFSRYSGQSPNRKIAQSYDCGSVTAKPKSSNDKARKDNMISQFDIFYEVVDPITQETVFVTEDRYIAEHHYGEGYTVSEKHITITKLSQFAQTQHIVILCWQDKDSTPKFEEA